MKLALAAVLAVVIAGCGAFVRVHHLTDTERVQARSNVREYRTEADLPSSSEFRGSLEANSCKNQLWDPPASTADAIDQLKFQARNVGADAIVNVRCTPPQGTSLATNCWQLITCYADAVRLTGEPKPSQAVRTTASGSCFAVSPSGMVLTSYHVVEGAKSIKVFLSDGREVLAAIDAFSAANDVAVLTTGVPAVDYLTIAPGSEVSLGDPVFTIGFPVQDVLGSSPKYSEGSISALTGPRGDASFLQISTPLNPGSSGSPVINERGQVVGIVVASAAIEPFYKATGSLPQNINWATKASVVDALFEAPPPETEPSRRAAISRAERAACRVEAGQ